MAGTHRKVDDEVDFSHTLLSTERRSDEPCDRRERDAVERQEHGVLLRKHVRAEGGGARCAERSAAKDRERLPAQREQGGRDADGDERHAHQLRRKQPVHRRAPCAQCLAVGREHHAVEPGRAPLEAACAQSPAGLEESAPPLDLVYPARRALPGQALEELVDERRVDWLAHTAERRGGWGGRPDADHGVGAADGRERRAVEPVHGERDPIRGDVANTVLQGSHSLTERVAPQRGARLLGRDVGRPTARLPPQLELAAHRGDGVLANQGLQHLRAPQLLRADRRVGRSADDEYHVIHAGSLLDREGVREVGDGRRVQLHPVARRHGEGAVEAHLY
ncbi:hypothetical protein T492DRAFT_838921 [Pavlovales sp. CCMP2436]|nr:hypothetical protein T492DRAFT_838921 [Pavlovales sp. CCMP2436]